MGDVRDAKNGEVDDAKCQTEAAPRLAIKLRVLGNFSLYFAVSFIGNNEA